MYITSSVEQNNIVGMWVFFSLTSLVDGFFCIPS